MRIIRSTDSRRTETPAAVMTTLASPGQGGAANPVWRVDAAADIAGPVHVIDAEQIWTVLAGTVALTIEEASTELGAGDTVVVPGDVPRQFTPGADGFAAVVTGPAGMRAYMPGSPDKKIDLAWAA